jgi:hypothetical protein
MAGEFMIWVDADACPRAIKEILYRSSVRTKTPLTLVANAPLSTPRSPLINTITVPKGSDMADKTIVEKVQSGDLVISGDIILADLVISRGGTVLSPRGDEFTSDNIGEYLSTRTFMSELRSAGLASGGPPAMTNADKERFANRLETVLRRLALRHKNLP